MHRSREEQLAPSSLGAFHLQPGAIRQKSEQASPSADTVQGRALQSSQPGAGRQIEGRSTLDWICWQTFMRHLERAVSHQDICSANLCSHCGKESCWSPINLKMGSVKSLLLVPISLLVDICGSVSHSRED